MLVLTRKQNEEIFIEVNGARIVLRVTDVMRGKVRLGITAPPHVKIARSELAAVILPPDQVGAPS